MKYYAIIVAGGSGARMNNNIPKQFLPLNGKPVLMHTLEAFYNSDLHPELLLVLNETYFEIWKNLCTRHAFRIPFRLINGGDQRFQSVKNALDFVDDDAIVAVHDAVRPLITNTLITDSFILAGKQRAVVPVVPSKDSVRLKAGDESFALKREDVMLVQTPQVFQSSLLKKAYLKAYSTAFTDDAAVVEATGTTIYTIPGEYKNIKITYPEDLELAELFLKHRT